MAKIDEKRRCLLRIAEGVVIGLTVGMGKKGLELWCEVQKTADLVPQVGVVGTYSANIGFGRNNIFQAENRYTFGNVVLKLDGKGGKTSEDLHVQLTVPSGVKIRGVSGYQGIKIARGDGTFVPIAKVGEDWPESEQTVLARIDKLPPGIEYSMAIEFYYDTGASPDVPSAVAWDDCGTYSISWEPQK